ncbi:MAG: helix-turn-helix domain-containing protein [Planctomycetota bacterium]
MNETNTVEPPPAQAQAVPPGQKNPDTQEPTAATHSPPPKRALANVVPMLGSGQRAVSRQDAGRMLGVSWRTIERLVDRGELRAFKLLGQWRILVSDLDAYVARQILEQKTRIGA